MTAVLFCLAAALFAAVMYGPGLAVTRLALRLPWAVAAASAPAVSAAIVGIASYAAHAANVWWSWTPFLVTSAVAVAVAALGRQWALRARVPGWHSLRPGARGPARMRASRGLSVAGGREGDPGASGPRTRRRQCALFAGAGACGALLIAIPMVAGMGSVTAPSQQWDAVFHLNALASIFDSGDAFSLRGMWPDGSTSYYPAVWHAATALTADTLSPWLFTVGRTAIAWPLVANAAIVATATLIWLPGVYALTRVVAKSHRIAALATVIAPAFAVFPTFQLSVLAQWPAGLSVAVVPGVLALSVFALDHERGRPRVASLLVAAAGAIGAGMLHGSALVAIAVMVLPLAVSRLWPAFRSALRARRAATVAVTAAAAAAIAATVYVAARIPTIAMLFSYQREPIRSYPLSVLHTVFDVELLKFPGNLAITAFVIVGAVAAWRAASRRWLVWTTMLVIVLTAIAAGPDGPVRQLTAIWYLQPSRIEALYPACAAVLAALGVDVFARGVARQVALRAKPGGRARNGYRVAAVGALVLAVAVSGGYQFAAREDSFAQSYVPGKIRWGTIANRDALQVASGAWRVVDKGALVIGDPFQGAAYVWSLGDRNVVYPTLSTARMDADQQFLAANFSRIGKDERVCAALARVGATYLFYTQPSAFAGAKPTRGFTGFSAVDLASGFTPVLVAGSAGLYRITACD